MHVNMHLYIMEYVIMLYILVCEIFHKRTTSEFIKNYVIMLYIRVCEIFHKKQPQNL